MTLQRTLRLLEETNPRALRDQRLLDGGDGRAAAVARLVQAQGGAVQPAFHGGADGTR